MPTGSNEVGFHLKREALDDRFGASSTVARFGF